MFNFTFGLIWLAFSIPVFLITIGFFGGESNGIAAITLLLFVIIGFYLMIKGLKQIIKDLKTKRYGMECYGIIGDIKETGAYKNHRPEYKAIVHFVNPETHQIEKLEEIIGFDYDKYSLDSYVKCKYYQGDINIEEQIYGYIVPEAIKEYLEPLRMNSGDSGILVSDDREYVIIDGVRYRREY